MVCRKSGVPPHLQPLKLCVKAGVFDLNWECLQGGVVSTLSCDRFATQPLKSRDKMTFISAFDMMSSKTLPRHLLNHLLKPAFTHLWRHHLKQICHLSIFFYSFSYHPLFIVNLYILLYSFYSSSSELFIHFLFPPVWCHHHLIVHFISFIHLFISIFAVLLLPLSSSVILLVVWLLFILHVMTRVVPFVFLPLFCLLVWTWLTLCFLVFGSTVECLVCVFLSFLLLLVCQSTLSTLLLKVL